MDVIEGGESELGQARMKKAGIQKKAKTQGHAVSSCAPLGAPLYSALWQQLSGGFLRFTENSLGVSVSRI